MIRQRLSGETMQLKKLIKFLPSNCVIRGPKNVEVTGICAHSRFVAPGNLFVARKGLSCHGSQFIPQAVDAGASVILTDMYDPTLKEVTQMIHPEVESIEGILSSAYYGFPSQSLFAVGITGTNGKTTISYLVHHLLNTLGDSCGLVGSIEYLTNGQRYQASHTTPDVHTNHRLLREMILNDCRSVVMETTSHGLDQGRVEEIQFDIGVFTNLTQDHLDYHSSMEEYAKAKGHLFASLTPGKVKSEVGVSPVAILCADDPWFPQMASYCSVPVVTFGMDSSADFFAEKEEMTLEGSRFSLCAKGEQHEVFIPLLGRHNIYNTLAALAICSHKGYALEELIQALASFPGVPGRLEKVKDTGEKSVFVDFSHTEDSLKKALQTLKTLGKGKVIVVFGCGGDRDTEKRPKMGRVAESNAMISVITSDNPRSEDPMTICRQIQSGYKGDRDHRVIVEPDRRKAIAKALEEASEEDCVLIAGKGHEYMQIFAHHTVPFDDRSVAQELCHCPV